MGRHCEPTGSRPHVAPDSNGRHHPIPSTTRLAAPYVPPTTLPFLLLAPLPHRTLHSASCKPVHPLAPASPYTPPTTTSPVGAPPPPLASPHVPPIADELCHPIHLDLARAEPRRHRGAVHTQPVRPPNCEDVPEPGLVYQGAVGAGGGGGSTGGGGAAGGAGAAGSRPGGGGGGVGGWGWRRVVWRWRGSFCGG